MSDSFPQVIGKYRIEGIIAKGGMGVVYKAIHPSLKRYVVIKKMTARGNAANAERFKREAQILLDLQSPYIVHLFDYFTEGGFRYMVEELVDGMALDKLLNRQKVLPPQLALLILQDACFALKYAHSKDIVHRDIKPGNILISKRSEIKLADFGIASGEKEQNEPSLTQSGIALGTPAYMPPEQYENSSKVDQRADIYALGVMLYEMVTGTKPYPGTLSVETLNLIHKGKYIQPRRIDKTIPAVVCRLIHKMLQPNPRRRYQSTDPIIKIVRRYLKHYDVHAIRVQLARAILAPKPIEFSHFIPKDKTQKKVILVTACIAVAAAACAVLWYEGFFYKTILRRIYTPVCVEMEMPPTSAAGSDLPVRAFFFENTEDVPEVPGSRRIFNQQQDKAAKNDDDAASKPAPRNRTYTIKTVYLKHGNYRVKVAAGPYVWWKSFSVGEEGQIVKCNFLKNARRPLAIKPHAYDGVTGRDISSSSTFTVLYNGMWRRIETLPASELTSGTVWKITVSCPGYDDELFSLLIDWYQDEIFISADLQPQEK